MLPALTIQRCFAPSLLARCDAAASFTASSLWQTSALPSGNDNNEAQVRAYVRMPARPKGIGQELSFGTPAPSWAAPLHFSYSSRGFAAEAVASVPKEEVQKLHQGLRKGFAVAECAKEYSFDMTYSAEYAESIKPIHKTPKKLHEHLALAAIRLVRFSFDTVTGYRHNKPQTETQWLRRLIFLETVAGVPGMCAGMLRHLMSLRTMERDRGWIHTLLEEAENERMHLLTFMTMRKPGFAFRSMVIVTQGIFFNFYFVYYIISPKFCHAMVGYLEEEAVRTYTHLLSDIDSGHVWKDVDAPPIGVNYWKLGENAKMRDLILAVRADEACHSKVNHVLSELKPNDDNPFVAGHTTTAKY